MNNTIFKYLKPEDNIKLSKLSSSDLLDAIILINDCNLSLRNTLNLNKDITFGLEIEFEDIKDKIKLKEIKEIYPNSEWGIIKNEVSLYQGAEISSPILTDTEENWQDLEKVCTFLNQLATIDKYAGGHIHIGANILGNDKIAWLNLFKLWGVYENIFFRFLYGEYLTHRHNITSYSKPIAPKLLIYYKELKDTDFNLEDIIIKLCHIRHQAINFRNINTSNIENFKEKNTIEFRCPNGTINPIIWQNNTNLLTKLLLYCKSINYNHDTINKRYEIKGKEFNDLKWYNEIYLEQALELSDMIFDNNIDKIYFLKQYLKQFKTCKNDNNQKKLSLFKKE